MSPTAIAGLSLETVLYEKKGGIAYITMNRPKVLNALIKKAVVDCGRLQDASTIRKSAAAIITGPAKSLQYRRCGHWRRSRRTRRWKLLRKTRDGQSVMDLIEKLGQTRRRRGERFPLLGGAGDQACVHCSHRVGTSSVCLK